MNFIAKGTLNGEAVEIPVTVPDNLPEDQIGAYVKTFVDTHLGEGGRSLTPEERIQMLGGFVESPGEGSAAPGFFDKLGSEISGGVTDIAEGLGGEGPVVPPNILGIARAGLGAARVVGSPLTAFGAMLGKGALEMGAPGPVAAVADAAGSTLGSMGAGKAAQATGQAVRRGLPYVLPGASGAMLESGKDAVRALPKSLSPLTPSEDLYQVVDQMNPAVSKLPTLEKVASEIAENEEKLAKFGVESRVLINTAANISETMQPAAKTVMQPSASILNNAGLPIQQSVTTSAAPTFNFQDVRNVLRRIGQRIDDLRDPMRRSTGSGEELGAMKQLYGALISDLEKSGEAGVGQASQALRVANSAAKREFATKELSDVIESGIKHVQGGQLPESVNFGTMMNNLKKEVSKNELFTQAFSADELSKIQSTLDELRKLPVPPPPRGVNAGSYAQGRRAGLGGLIGYGLTGTTEGAVAGSMGGVAASNLLASALMTDTGRSFLLRIVKSQPGLLFSPKGFALLGAASRAGTAVQAGELDLGPSEAGAADIPLDEIERRQSIMGDLSGIGAVPESIPSLPRNERLQMLLKEAVRSGDAKRVRSLKQAILNDAVSE